MSEEGAVSPAKGAELYDVSVDVIRAAYRSGLLPCRYVGSAVRIKRSDLEAWFDALPTERQVSA